MCVCVLWGGGVRRGEGGLCAGDSCKVTEVPPEQRSALAGHGRYGPSEGGKINGPVTQTGCELSPRHARLNTLRQHGAFVSATKDSRFVCVLFLRRPSRESLFFFFFQSFSLTSPSFQLFDRKRGGGRRRRVDLRLQRRSKQ